MSPDPLPFVVLALASALVLGPFPPALLALPATVLALMRARFRTTPARVVQADVVPRVHRLLLGATGEALASLGFESVRWLEAPGLRIGDPRERAFALTAWHPGHATTAVATIGGVPNGIPVQVAFVTAFGDGGSLRTVNRLRWLLPPGRPGQTVEDPCCDDLRAQWAAHRRALTGRQGSVTDSGEALRRVADEAFGQAAYEHLCAIGWMRAVSPGTWRYTLAGGLRVAWGALRVPDEVRAALQRPWRQQPAPDRAWVEFADLQQAAADLAPAAGRHVPITGAVAAVAAVAGGAAFAAFSPAPWPAAFGAALAALLAVGLHLFGRHRAARSIGLSGSAAALVPLVDALAFGERRPPSAARQAAALLAVPVIGILLGAAALASATAASWPVTIDAAVRTFGWVVLALGATELLPFRRCAGLRLLELGALAHAPRVLPWLWAVMLALVAIGFGLLALPLVALLVPALVDVLRSAHGMGLAGAVRETVGPSSRAPMSASGAMTALAFELSNRVAARLPVAGSARGRLHAIATAQACLTDGVPPVARAGALLAAHALVLALAIGAAVHAAFPPLSVGTGTSPAADVASAGRGADAGTPGPGARALPVRPPPRLDPRSAFLERYGEEDDPARRWAMLESPEARTVMRDDGQSAVSWLDVQRVDVLGLLPDDHPARTAAERDGRLAPVLDPELAQRQLLRRAAVSADPQVVHGSLRRVLDAAGDLRPCSADRRVGGVVIAYDRLQRGFPEVLTPEDHAAIARALDALLAPSCRDAMWSNDAPLLASAVARASLAAGRRAQADATMARLAAAEAVRVDRHDGVAQGWYLLEKGEPQAALDAAREALAAPPTAPRQPLPGTPGQHPAAAAPGDGAPVVLRDRKRWLALAGWAALALGRPAEADASFREALDLEVRVREAGRAGTAGLEKWVGDRLIGSRDPRQEPGPMTMDRLVALRGYDSAAAERLRTTLLQAVLERRSVLRIDEASTMPYGWGAQRRDAHQRLRDALRADAQAILAR